MTLLPASPGRAGHLSRFVRLLIDLDQKWLALTEETCI
jgi:hypothetical protein